jgi:hypothetical protein
MALFFQVLKNLAKQEDQSPAASLALMLPGNPGKPIFPLILGLAVALCRERLDTELACQSLRRFGPD